MKTLATMSLALALCGAGVGAAEASNLYVKLDGGANFQSAENWGGLKYDMNTGWDVGGALGYNLSPHVSVEADVLHTDTTYKGYTSHLKPTSVMGNVLYHFDAFYGVKPYIGAGLGTIDSAYSGYDGNNWQHWVFGGQVFGGVSVPVTKQLSAFTEYRFQDAARATQDLVGFSRSYDYQSHNLLVGLQYAF